MNNHQIQFILEVAKKAGDKIVEIYQSDFSVQQKGDQSPVTKADIESHHIIVEGLNQIDSNIPVLSEEGKGQSYEHRKGWERFWLIDPLDGTKEFIQKNGEFTVNIALIEKDYPILGVIYAPVLNIFYVGIQGIGAYKVDETANQTMLKANSDKKDSLTLVESRSHPSKELEDFISSIEHKYSHISRIPRGSSLKLCAIAEGLADLYPRIGPTMEWDTAAGQAIVEAAGGKVVTLDGKRLRYNKESLLNASFLVLGNMDILD